MAQSTTDSLTLSQKEQTVSSPLKNEYALALIMVLALIIRFSSIGQMDIWFDEAVSTLIARNHVNDIIGLSPTVTVNPPLYYIALHLWGYVISDIPGARILSILFGLASVYMLYLLGLRLLGPRVALAAALLGAISPFQVYYSQELRMYSLLSFLSTGIIYSALGIYYWRRAKDWLGFILFSVAGLYAHYFAGITLGLTLLGLLVAFRHQRVMAVRTMACGLLVAMLFLPWLPSFRTNTGNVYDMRSTGSVEAAPFNLPIALLGTLKSFSVGNEQTVSLADNNLNRIIILPGCLIFLCLLLLGLARGPDRPQAFLLGGFIISALLLVILISGKMHLYLNRYLIIINGPFYLLAARGLMRLEMNRKVFAAVAVLLISILIAANFNRIFNVEYKREEFREASAYVRDNYLPGDRVVHASLFTLYPFKEYHEGATDEYVFDATAAVKRTEGLIDYGIIGYSGLGHGRIWWVMPITVGSIQSGQPWFSLPGHGYEADLRGFEEEGFMELEREDFRGLRIVLLKR